MSGTSLMNMIHAGIINSLLSRHVDLYFMKFHIGSVFYQLLPKAATITQDLSIDMESCTY